MKRVRGIALLVALIIVALATAIAGAIAFDTGLGLRRAQGGFAQDQALQLAGGAEAIAAQILVEELASGTAAIHTPSDGGTRSDRWNRSRACGSARDCPICRDGST